MSLAITVQLPNASTEFKSLTITFFLLILFEAIVNAIVSASGNPSGIEDTASATTDKKIALVLKSRGAYTGKLDLPGGSIEHGETPIETLKREIKEELNCEVKESKLFDVNSVVVRWNHNNIEDELHHIGMFYTAILKDNNLKDDSDGFDSLGADWYLIDKLK